MLNTLSDNLGARKKRTRVCRGIGSGKGKTGGRGHKGQKSRSGVSIKGFEGGQMPLYQRLPKRGFSSRKDRKVITTLNVEDLQRFVEAKRLDAKETITLKLLQEKACVRSNTEVLRILAAGDVKVSLTVEAHHVTPAARGKIEKAKGSVKLLTN